MMGYQGNPMVSTPFLDTFVREEALQLTRHYAFSVCSPTRASLLTGRSPPWNSVDPDHQRFNSLYGPTLDYTLLPERLHDAGYATHCAPGWLEPERN